MELSGKTVILTGATRIGRTVAKALAKRGANLVVSYNRSADVTHEIKKECEMLGTTVAIVQADLSQLSDVASVVAAAKKEFGHIDGLVHMAANYPRTPWDKLTEKDWDSTVALIAKSAFLVSKAAGDEMLKNKGEIKGKIITFSDWSVLRNPYKDYLIYNSAKSAVVGLTLSLAKELAPHIMVNSIAPGPILKPPGLTDAENTEAMSRTPLKRWGGAEEITKAVLYLLDADFVTGQILTVDGGRSIA